MFLFSQTLNAFRARLEHVAMRIAYQDMRINVADGLATDLDSDHVFPFPRLTVFDDGRRLGFFDPTYPMIGISKSLCHQAKTPVIEDILRHELAHWMGHRDDPHAGTSHGPAFRSICKRYGWGRHVWSATVDLSEANAQVQGDLPSDALISRVQKLLQLAQSDNPHEAELATLRANQLMLKHHLTFVQDNPSPTVYMDAVMQAKRADAKLRAISQILRSFLVYPVINRISKGVVLLEVTGPDKTSVIMAKYVAAFLDDELDRLWLDARRKTGLGGSSAKANFMRGVAQGYLAKQSKSCSDTDSQKALCRIEDHLKGHIKLVYPHLRQAQFRMGRQDQALNVGADAGTDLCIQKPIDSSRSTKLLPG